MQHLSDQLRVAATVALTVAMYLFAVEYAFGRRPARAVPVAARPARQLVRTGARNEPPTLSPPSRPPADVQRPGTRERVVDLIGRVAVATTALGWLGLLGCLITRGLAAGRVPWGNMYEFALTVCLVAVTGLLVLVTRWPVRYLGAFALLPVVLLLGLAGTVIYTPVAPLVPALNSYWLKIHVTAAVLATGVFLVAFATAVMYLLRERYDRLTAADRVVAFPTTLGARLPEASVLERTTFRTVALGFPVWSFAVMAGAIWAEAAWGRSWRG